MNRTLALTTALAIIVAARIPAWSDGGHEHGHKAQDDMHTKTHAQAHWSAPSHAQATVNPVEASAASIRTGATLYKENCAACHGTNGRGDGSAAATLEVAPADLVSMAPNHSDGDFAWKIANGRGEMPGWGEILEPEEIWHVVNYLKELPRFAATKSESGKTDSAGETVID